MEEINKGVVQVVFLDLSKMRHTLQKKHKTTCIAEGFVDHKMEEE